MQADKEEEAKSGFPCPLPIYSWARELKNVASWGEMTIIQARELKKKDPWFFSVLALCQQAEAEAEPIQLKTAQAEAEAEHKQAAQPGASI